MSRNSKESSGTINLQYITLNTSAFFANSNVKTLTFPDFCLVLMFSLAADIVTNFEEPFRKQQHIRFTTSKLAENVYNSGTRENHGLGFHVLQQVYSKTAVC